MQTMANGRIVRLLLLGAILCFLWRGTLPAATITFSVGMGNVTDMNGTKIATDALFQLIDLGADGAFNPISEGSWVSGDDSLINVPFTNADGWAGTAAFDLVNGIGNPGEFSRQFTLTLGAAVFPGQKIGIRWFPTLKAADYAVSSVSAGLPYGEFTRQTSPLYGGTAWVIPAAGSLVTFDPMVTGSYDAVNGHDPNASGAASSVVVPEPEAAMLLIVGLVPLVQSRRLSKAAARVNKDNA